VQHEHLTVAVRAAADPDRWDRDAPRDLGRELVFDHLEHDGECPSLGDPVGVAQQPVALAERVIVLAGSPAEIAFTGIVGETATRTAILDALGVGRAARGPAYEAAG
jgi:hypothetical protein